MIEKFTAEQQAKIAEYRARYFAQATSTEPADRDRAEKAAVRLAEIGGVKVKKIQWIRSTMEWYSLRNSLWDSLWDSLRDSLKDSLRNSLWYSLWDSLWYSLWDSLRDSLWDSLLDTGWTCFYTFAVEELGVEISDEHRELLNLHNEIAASCFAVWIVPGAVILCERPESVDIDDGKLVGITWRTAPEGE